VPEKASPTFSMVHLFHRFYGVDAPVVNCLFHAIAAARLKAVLFCRWNSLPAALCVPVVDCKHFQHVLKTHLDDLRDIRGTQSDSTLGVFSSKHHVWKPCFFVA